MRRNMETASSEKSVPDVFEVADGIEALEPVDNHLRMPLMDILRELIRIYPDRRIKRMEAKHPVLHGDICSYAEDEGLSYSEFLMAFGYQVVITEVARPKIHNLKSDIKQLRDMYPDGKVTYLLSTNRKLWNRLIGYAKDRNMSLSALLEEHQLVYVLRNGKTQ